MINIAQLASINITLLKRCAELTSHSLDIKVPM